MPIAFARSTGPVKRFMMRESAIAETTAPPSPWTALATTSRPWEPAFEDAVEHDDKNNSPFLRSSRLLLLPSLHLATALDRFARSEVFQLEELPDLDFGLLPGDRGIGKAHRELHRVFARLHLDD